ncbi:MAG: LamG-like jellyroll fold domain-containing protein [Anaerolineales bacterium]|jgi:hypothetical protein
MVGIGTRLGLSKLSGGLFEKILGTETDDLIVYFPMDEESGSTADNAEGTAARDGAYTGVTLGQSVSPFTAPLFDGVNDYLDIYSANFASAFNGTDGTMMGFAKVSGAGVWTDGIDRRVINISAGVDYIYIARSAANNKITMAYRASGGGATFDNVSEDVGPTTDWKMYALTWTHDGGDELKAYIDGSQAGATQTGLAEWITALSVAGCNIGSYNTTPIKAWDGYLAHCAIWTKALTAAQLLAIYEASGVA